MDFALLIPFAPFLMIVGIVWVRSQAKLEEKRIEAAAASGGMQSAQQAEEMVELRERVRVLERIVTNSGYDLASQIEALRDERPAGRLETSRRAEAVERIG